MLEGKGRGVIATRDMAPGDVVLATAPLAFVASPHRQRPSGELVVDQILDRRLYGSKWFSVLYDGSARSSKAQFGLAPGTAPEPSPSGDSTGVGADAPRSAQPPEPVLASTSAPSAGAKGGAGGGATAAAATPKKKGFLASRAAARRSKGAAPAGDVAAAVDSAEGRAAAQTLPLPDRREQTRLAKIVKFNCFGDDAEDLAAAACRGEEPRGHIGLWPEFALLNHSCAPNAVNFVVGDAMVVRACRPIRAGEEVTISYLGRPQLLPFRKRISILSEDYGFECTCQRCVIIGNVDLTVCRMPAAPPGCLLPCGPQAEEAHYDKVEDVYGELAEAVEERLGPAFLEARDKGDTEAIAELQREVQSWLRRLYGLFRKTLLAPDVRHYVVASMYDAYDLALSCATALGQGEDASSLQACLKAMELVSGGSDLHVILAVRHHDATVQAHGEGSPLARLAREALRRAHVARYGPVSEALMERLVRLNRELHVQDG
ncbi:hypothetical protein GPECTOR_36g24 [Gonium pectorale]|uniref:SET domain-containing protein n=1 Tax=Gonium pectorale TaxID=33097 RepID=A0A150GBU2_GONPE|nr:hypothetical protein GPECTOR_36g24 [Gonium pectorale]|eukprot:KXZ47298.1 hypothetical protein GPECTOR_36g24 [Gonium pectorale]